MARLRAPSGNYSAFDINPAGTAWTKQKTAMDQKLAPMSGAYESLINKALGQVGVSASTDPNTGESAEAFKGRTGESPWWLDAESSSASGGGEMTDFDWGKARESNANVADALERRYEQQIMDNSAARGLLGGQGSGAVAGAFQQMGSDIAGHRLASDVDLARDQANYQLENTRLQLAKDASERDAIQSAASLTRGYINEQLGGLGQMPTVGPSAKWQGKQAGQYAGAAEQAYNAFRGSSTGSTSRATSQSASGSGYLGGGAKTSRPGGYTQQDLESAFSNVKW